MHLESCGRRFSQVLVQIGCRKQRMGLGLFTLHSPAGTLSGVFCLHVDDMLGTGDELFETKLKELDALVGFGSMKLQTVRSLREAVRKNMPMAKSRFQ